jgi:hypothetical protein
MSNSSPWLLSDAAGRMKAGACTRLTNPNEVVCAPESAPWDRTTWTDREPRR